MLGYRTTGGMYIFIIYDTLGTGSKVLKDPAQPFKNNQLKLTIHL